jgi:tripartite-type tricarboxylate transporter receptor subunit TctC
MRLFTKTLVGLVIAAGIGFLPTVASAQDYPDRPIRVIVPFAPGGITDLTARTFARAISDEKLLPQPITVVNMPGGAVGSQGSRNVKDSSPDGYTLLIHHLGMMSAQAAGTWDFGYKDFVPVAGTTDFCHTLVVGQDSPINSFQDFLQEAKSKPDAIVYGANLGGNIHMVGLLVQNAMPGAKLRIVQIGGEAENVTAIKGGIIQASTVSTTTYNQYKAEGLKPLVVFAPERDPSMPDIPTAKELGYDISFCVQHWWFAPKGTPQGAVDTMANALEKAMQAPALKDFFTSHSMQLTFEKGPELAAKLDATYSAIVPIAQQAAQN